MSAVILDGKAMAAQVEADVRSRTDALRAADVVPQLLVILAGDNAASQTYVRNKEKACERVGIASQTLCFPADVRQEEIEAAIAQANADPAVHGILLQLPLPAQLDESRLLSLIDPRKDVDGFHAENLGKLCRGEEGSVACTPQGVLYMLKAAGIPIDGQNAVVIGRSTIVGKPMALLLLRENATVTVCHSHTKNLPQITRQADLLICAVGRPRFVTADMVKEGACVIDVGINRTESGLCGDVNFEAVREKAGWISPVPGGVGKMTVAMLMDSTVRAAERAGKV